MRVSSHNILIVCSVFVVASLVVGASEVASPRSTSFGTPNDTVVIEAAGQGNLTVVEESIAAHASVDGTEKKRGATALHFAAANGHRTTVAFLIGKGAAIDASDAGGATPLVYAAYSGHVDVVRDLLDARANFNIVPAAAPTPLMAALQSGSSVVVRMLVAAGADPELRDSFGLTPRQFARQIGATSLEEALSTPVNSGVSR